MNYFLYFKLYLLMLIVFFAVDLLWLGIIAKNFYNQNLGFILSPNINWTAAVIFYMLYISAMIIFAVLPGADFPNVWRTLLLGALFGFITYATYDLTNLATIEKWPLKIVVVDILWGTVLGATVSSAGFFILRWLK